MQKYIVIIYISWPSAKYTLYLSRWVACGVTSSSVSNLPWPSSNGGSSSIPPRDAIFYGYGTVSWLVHTENEALGLCDIGPKHGPVWSRWSSIIIELICLQCLSWCFYFLRITPANGAHGCKSMVRAASILLSGRGVDAYLYSRRWCSMFTIIFVLVVNVVRGV